MKSVSKDELKHHNSEKNCWVVVKGKVWDVTRFLPSHPGGDVAILHSAGGDGTASYEANHAAGTLEANAADLELIGVMENTWVPDKPLDPKALQPSKNMNASEKPPLWSLINAHDFESVAQKYQSAKTYAYYASAATDLNSLRMNRKSYDMITFLPRVMRDMSKVSTECAILGHKTVAPFFIAPAATANQAHPEGEVILARGAGESGIIHCISTAATRTPEDIIDAGKPGQVLFFQLYVNRERKRTEELVRCVEEKGFKALFVTADTADRGKREGEEKADIEIGLANPSNVAANSNRRKAMASSMSGFIDPSLSWKDLAWLRSITKLPIVVKGIATAADARLAADHGCQGIVLSNHGGRNLDTAPAPLVTLLSIHKQCAEIFDKLEVYIDGGVRRGTDILKALCLGVTAVGIGRPYIYSMMYGVEGVEQLTALFREEFISAMRLTGCKSLSDVSPNLVSTKALDHLVADSEDHPYIKWRPRARI